jgi:two-component system cell cycle sensor histidine kinase/response regulator CckA
MTENLLLEQPCESHGTCLVETNPYGVDCDDRRADPVVPFPKDNGNCALVVQPGHLLREVAHLAAEVFPPNIAVQADVPEELWPISGDPGAMHQALIDVLLNARAAMPEGGHLALSARNVAVADVPDTPFFDAPAGDYVEMVFADTGPDVDHDTEGRSIGPDFVRMARVLRNHGGYARIEARAGQGTTVFLYFRRAVIESGLIDSGAGTATRPAGSILVVDDEEAILGLCQLILTRAGYDVLVAHNGSEALALFERRRAEIGLVLTDLVMPDMNGITLVWALRRSKPGLRVMVTTGEGSEDDLRELASMGVRQVLFKPFTPRRLTEAVSQTFAEPVRCEPELFLV